MLSENEHAQSSGFASRSGRQTRAGESAANDKAHEGAGAHSGAAQSESGWMNGPDFSAAFSHLHGFPPHFGGGGYGAFGQVPFGTWPFAMSPPGAPYFVPPFGMGPFGMFSSAPPEPYQWHAGGPWPHFPAQGASPPWWLWSWITSWWSWLMSLWPGPRPMIRHADPGFDPMLRSAITAAEFWCHWFETMAEMARQARQACQLFTDAGMARPEQHGAPATAAPWAAARPDGTRPDDSVDLKQLRESLKSMDPRQAAQVLHAVQMVQAMDRMQQRQRSRPNGATAGIW
jgi:hypothetical protein